MRRNHTAQHFVDFVSEAHNGIRDVCIGTDVLVGAPGETEEDFEDTMRVIRESPLTYAHVFKYSEREGTVASRNPDKVDPKVQNREKRTRTWAQHHQAPGVLQVFPRPHRACAFRA